MRRLRGGEEMVQSEEGRDGRDERTKPTRRTNSPNSTQRTGGAVTITMNEVRTDRGGDADEGEQRERQGTGGSSGGGRSTHSMDSGKQRPRAEGQRRRRGASQLSQLWPLRPLPSADRSVSRSGHSAPLSSALLVPGHRHPFHSAASCVWLEGCRLPLPCAPRICPSAIQRSGRTAWPRSLASASAGLIPPLFGAESEWPPRRLCGLVPRRSTSASDAHESLHPPSHSDYRLALRLLGLSPAWRFKWLKTGPRRPRSAPFASFSAGSSHSTAG